LSILARRKTIVQKLSSLSSIPKKTFKPIRGIRRDHRRSLANCPFDELLPGILYSPSVFVQCFAIIRSYVACNVSIIDIKYSTAERIAYTFHINSFATTTGQLCSCAFSRDSVFALIFIVNNNVQGHKRAPVTFKLPHVPRVRNLFAGYVNKSRTTRRTTFLRYRVYFLIRPVAKSLREFQRKPARVVRLVRNVRSID